MLILAANLFKHINATKTNFHVRFYNILVLLRKFNFNVPYYIRCSRCDIVLHEYSKTLLNNLLFGTKTKTSGCRVVSLS